MMLEFLMTNPAFALLKKDHDTVKDDGGQGNVAGQGCSTSGGGCDGGSGLDIGIEEVAHVGLIGLQVQVFSRWRCG